ncbi:MAG: hypothetical protein Crog4KO_08140 [Crocinitomicaceae bacterium]
MKLSPIFKLREQATPAIIQLLESVTLGTNGAHYRHLDTRERIHTADNPLHLSMERNERVIGNVTFCKREKTWYVRYFAFDKLLQGTGKVKSKSSGGLKGELQQFFDGVISKEQPFGEVNSFYAYIDPNNEKSLWMGENFGFERKADIATQTFSRSKLTNGTSVEKTSDWEEVAPVIRKEFSGSPFYFEHHVKSGPYYILRGQDGEIVACCKSTAATWAIERLPGKLGGILPRAIPFIPRLRKIIQPKRHHFLVPEAVYVKNHDPKLLQELFEGMLSLEKRHLIIWWVDETSPMYQAAKTEVKWGLLHCLVGVNRAHLVVKQNNAFTFDNSTPVYTCGFDFV